MRKSCRSLRAQRRSPRGAGQKPLRARLREYRLTNGEPLSLLRPGEYRNHHGRGEAPGGLERPAARDSHYRRELASRFHILDQGESAFQRALRRLLAPPRCLPSYGGQRHVQRPPRFRPSDRCREPHFLLRRGGWRISFQPRIVWRAFAASTRRSARHKCRHAKVSRPRSGVVPDSRHLRRGGCDPPLEHGQGSCRRWCNRGGVVIHLKFAWPQCRRATTIHWVLSCAVNASLPRALTNSPCRSSC